MEKEVFVPFDNEDFDPGYNAEENPIVDRETCLEEVTE